MNLFYRKFGKGKPLFILHGLFGSGDNWLTIGKNLAEKFEVYLIDLRNHGQSFHSEEWNYRVMATDVYNLMMHLNLDKISLIGHSMGGKTAITFSTMFPKLTEKLVVVDIATKYYPVHHQEILEAINPLPIHEITSRKQAEQILSEKINNPGELQFLCKNLYWKDPKVNLLAWRFNAETITKKIEIVGEEQYAQGQEFTFPVLFVKGANSDYIKTEDEEGIRQLFPNAQFASVPNAGHWVQAEQPLLFFEAVDKFLSL